MQSCQVTSTFRATCLATILAVAGYVYVTSSNVSRKGSLQTKLNAGLSEQQQEDLFQNERSFHEVKL